ncbi:MAG: L-serine ammonia-lyase, iron-sulfur-dependent subunit beta [Lachnospiraceae bacterium]|nr:L-serine ammonia-lyase, iron-sulfur-dependent subunit beta [Lachnospiraceae bacterium]
MNLFDIVGPVMVGPSSSHTAGAAKIGNVARRLLNEDVAEAEILFHGSFLATGKGHGTDKALLAGLMGLAVDDPLIPCSFEIARQKGLKYRFGGIDLGDAHPNSVKLLLTGISGKKLELTASSIGGGRIEVNEVDGLANSFSGDYPTLIIQNQDQPGLVAEITCVLAGFQINIATLQLYRSSRGGYAVTVIECDDEVPQDVVAELAHEEGIVKVTYLSMSS